MVKKDHLPTCFHASGLYCGQCGVGMQVIWSENQVNSIITPTQLCFTSLSHSFVTYVLSLFFLQGCSENDSGSASSDFSVTSTPLISTWPAHQTFILDVIAPQKHESCYLKWCNVLLIQCAVECEKVKWAWFGDKGYLNLKWGQHPGGHNGVSIWLHQNWFRMIQDYISYQFFACWIVWKQVH